MYGMTGTIGPELQNRLRASPSSAPKSDRGLVQRQDGNPEILTRQPSMQLVGCTETACPVERAGPLTASIADGLANGLARVNAVRQSPGVHSTGGAVPFKLQPRMGKQQSRRFCRLALQRHRCQFNQAL
jgi:hypothetical protein